MTFPQSAEVQTAILYVPESVEQFRDLGGNKSFGFDIIAVMVIAMLLHDRIVLYAVLFRNAADIQILPAAYEGDEILRLCLDAEIVESHQPSLAHQFFGVDQHSVHIKKDRFKLAHDVVYLPFLSCGFSVDSLLFYHVEIAS